MCKRKGQKGTLLKVNDVGRIQGNMYVLDLDGELNLDGGFLGD